MVLFPIGYPDQEKNITLSALRALAVQQFYPLALLEPQRFNSSYFLERIEFVDFYGWIHF
jgi:hypothetical protein